jgi:branched-chain amino acid transport system permease protein
VTRRLTSRRIGFVLAALAIVIFVVGFQREAVAAWWKPHSLVVRQSLVSGLLIGGIYSLVAMGLSLIFGVMGIINFAHGSLMTVAMYATFWVFRLYGVDPYVSLLVTIPLLFLIGGLLQRIVIRPVMEAPEHNQLLVTLGISLFIQNFTLVLFKADPRVVKTGYSGARTFVSNTMISYPRVGAFVAGLVLAGILYLILTHSELGRAIRAAAEEKEGAFLVGINVDRIHLITFGLGTACVGAAGSLIMPFFTVTPTTGETFNIMAFVVVVLGGMGSVLGALLGGIIVGLTESLGAVFLPGSSKQLGVFLIFVLVLLFRPTGLLGRPQHD